MFATTLNQTKQLVLCFLAITLTLNLRPCMGFSVAGLSSRAQRCHTQDTLRWTNSLMRQSESDADRNEIDNEENSIEKSKKEGNLTPDKVAAMIEASFVDGVMQLAQGYVDVLKLFIAAILTGYGMRMTLTDLQTAVLTCPQQSANRPLMQEEEELRRLWIQLVYFIAKQVDYRSAVVQDAILFNDLDEQALDPVYVRMLPRLQEMHSQGDALGGPKFNAQSVLEKNSDLLSPSQMNNATQKALLLQNLRVMWMTLTVLEEERQCMSDKQPEEQEVMPPPPPIPNKLNGDYNP